MLAINRFPQSAIVALGLLAAAVLPAAADGLINAFDNAGTSLSKGADGTWKIAF